MALVPSTKTVTVKITLEADLAPTLERYAKFAGATKSRVVEIALTRLFKDDADWQQHLIDKNKES